MDKIDIKVVRPFGPTYAYVKIPNKILDSLNDYIDNLIKDQNKKAKLNFGESLVGDVTQEFLIEREIAEKSGWLNFLGTCIQKWIEIELNKSLEEASGIGRIAAQLAIEKGADELIANSKND